MKNNRKKRKCCWCYSDDDAEKAAPIREVHNTTEDTDDIENEDEETVQERVADFVSHTTFHGLDNVFLPGNTFGRTFWGIVLFVVIVIVTLQLKSLISFFFQNPTLTSISVIFPQEGLAFPPITICTLAKLNRTYINNRYNHMSQTTAEFATASFFSAFSTTLMDVAYFGSTNKTKAELQAQLDQDLGDVSFTDFIEDTTFDCEKQFLFCWFQNGEMRPCCNDDAANPIRIRRYLLHSGPCFVLEVSDAQLLPGPVGGIGLAYWYPNLDMFPTFFNSYDEHGIHLYTSPTEAMMEKNPIALQVGTHNHISLEATRTTRLSTDQLGRTTCIPQTLKFFDNYTYTACQVECLLNIMLDACGCVGFADYSSVPKEKVCGPSEALQCYEENAKNFTKNIIKCRQENCTEACQYWSYRPSVTAGKVFNPSLSDKMTQYWRLPNTSLPEQSLIIADIYFSDIQYTDVDQQPAVTLESFISNIGGAMGLWTGASIITWIHLVYFCCSSFKLRRQKRIERKRKATAEASMGLVVDGEPNTDMIGSSKIITPPTSL